MEKQLGASDVQKQQNSSTMETATNDSLEVGNYRLISKLGQGGFSSVYLCKNTKTNKKYAMKKIREVKPKYIEQELKAMKEISDANVVNLVEHFEFKDRTMLIIEYCEQGTLDQWLLENHKGSMKEDRALDLFSGILSGFRAIHKAGFIHRDLKCSNILMTNNTPKIADFGLSKKLASNHMTISASCTPSYSPPEVLKLQPHNYKVDIWALGVILYKMIFGCIPFSGDRKSLLLNINTLCDGGFKITKSPKKKIQEISVELIKLFKQIFVVDPKKRIGFKELYESDLLRTRMANLNESIEFYSSNQMFSKADMLLSSEIDVKPEDDNNNEEVVGTYDENEEKEEVMLTSLLLRPRLEREENQETAAAFTSYLACVNQYVFLIDNYEYFKQHEVLFASAQQENAVLVLRFFIAKMIVYLIRGLKHAIDEKENIFELNVNWAQFVFSKTYTQLRNRVAKDLVTWACELENLLSLLEATDATHFAEVRQFITSEIPRKETKYYMEFPNEVKLPFRAIVMTLMKVLHKDLNTTANNNNGAPKSPQVNQTSKNFYTSSPQQLSSHQPQQNQQNMQQMTMNRLTYGQKPKSMVNAVNRFSVAERERAQKANLLFRLTLCAAWNRLFSISNRFVFSDKKLDYDTFIKAIHISTTDECISNTNQIMEIYFPKLKSFTYSFL